MEELYQLLVFVVFSFIAPVVTFGGGILVSNALTFNHVNLIMATGITISYFLVNGLIVMVMFRKYIVWFEVKAILPLATIGSILGALVLSYMSPIFLLGLMLFFALRFLFATIFIKNAEQTETKISIWLMALLSGFLASAALPGGGLRNSYRVSA